MYRILKIEEDVDYGCEDRPEGQETQVIVTLESEKGERRIMKCSDAYLYEHHIEEGDQVSINADGSLKKEAAE